MRTFFSELGIWDKITRNFLGYRQAADAFKNKQLDAFGIFSGCPSSAVIETALQNKIKPTKTTFCAQGYLLWFDFAAWSKTCEQPKIFLPVLGLIKLPRATINRPSVRGSGIESHNFGQSLSQGSLFDAMNV
ncbi:MAG: hypothetical protein J7K32_06130 [Deltaproteobacteria bacterium]|nr:hypothetical protein [Deltaproteobacteria bacterium]